MISDPFNSTRVDTIECQHISESHEEIFRAKFTNGAVLRVSEKSTL